jgi:hypothetical protein
MRIEQNYLLCHSYVIQQRLIFQILRRAEGIKGPASTGQAENQRIAFSLGGHILTRQVFESCTRIRGVVLGSIRKFDNQSVSSREPGTRALYLLGFSGNRKLLSERILRYLRAKFEP